MNEENIIPTSDLENDFDHFIKIENNKRIFFSGRFGVGKTFLLKRYFDLHKDEFEVFHLFPINYQINRNEDIIDLLKYDLLIAILKIKPDIFEQKKSQGIKESAFLFYSFLKDKYSINDVLQSTISAAEIALNNAPEPSLQFLSKLGRPLKEWLKIDKEFQIFKKNHLLKESDLAEKYLEEIKSSNISETDYISHLIDQKIATLKESKKSVLILDDIDRVDPDHVFRILNIFSAHFNDKDNKFGFDTVIIVGDIKNLKSIFHHKYGKDADFQGYFDKFFTLRPYLLDNNKIVSERIPSLIKQIKYQEEGLKGAIGESGFIKLLLEDILSRALSLGKLNLRQLYKPLTHNFIELKSGVFNKDGFNSGFQQIFDIGIKLLIAIFGGDRDFFIEILKEIRVNISDSDNGSNAPYRRYSSSMVKRLFNNPVGEISWKDYSFTAQSERNEYLEVKGVDSNQAKLFFDLLIEYISKSKHIKINSWEYDD